MRKPEMLGYENNRGVGMTEDKPGEIKFRVNDSDYTHVFDVTEPQTIEFNCEKAILKPNEIMMDWGEGMPIDFDIFETMTFKSKKRTVTFKKVSVEENRLPEIDMKVCVARQVSGPKELEYLSNWVIEGKCQKCGNDATSFIEFVIEQGLLCMECHDEDRKAK